MLFAYLYVIRVPLICGLVVAFMRYTALKDTGSGTELLAGVFDVSPLGAMLIGLCMAWFTAACVVSADLTLHYARDRFDLPNTPTWMKAEDSAVWPWLKRHDRLRKCWTYLVEDLSTQAAMLIGVYLTLSFWLLQGIFLKSSITSGLMGEGSYLIGYLLMWVLLRGWGTKKGILFRPPKPICEIILRLAKWTPNGYSATGNGTADNDMTDYHAGAFVAMIISFIFYFLLFLAGLAGTLVPALACVILLITFLCWILSGLTFLVDRFRVPVLVLALAVFAYTGAWPEADHTFDTFNASSPLPSLAQIVSAGPGRFIAVAASGGGIHAAGWTTRVIGGLYQELPVELRAPFAKSIRVISAVSGGSVGSLYVLNAYRIDDFREGRFTSEQIDRYLFQPPVESTLDTMVQKLVFEDWWRTLMPGVPIVTDRGRAAEEAWRAAVKDDVDSRDWLGKPLGDWATLAGSGTAPAALFNSTIVDTGERAVLATAGFDKSRSGRRLLRELYGTPVDTSLVTAARLSATFPIVSPSARAAGVWPKRYRYHFVDGGYYDNYGMATLVEWLDDVSHAQSVQPEILLLQIRDSPENGAPRPAEGQAGFLSQMLAPFFTIFRFRDAGQIAHGNLESELLSAVSGNRVRRTSFAWPYNTSPLSWHLTEAEKQGLCNAFDVPQMTRSKRQVCDFLAGNDPALHDKCAERFEVLPK